MDKMTSYEESFEEQIDALYDIEDSVKEIKERGKDQYLDLETQVKDALVEQRQKEIDKLQAINDTLNETNQKLISSIRDSLDKQRQERDNARTEEEIAEKRARLSYLQMDTSGANALEIMELEEEIRQQEEDYTDTLIDQKISELEKQNEEAAAQREKQIETMQAQLDYWETYGGVWEKVERVLSESVGTDGKLLNDSSLAQLLMKKDGFEGMSHIESQEWLEELENNVAQAVSYLETGRQLEDIGVEAGKAIKFYYNGEELEGTVDEKGNVTTSDGRVFDNVFEGFGGKYYAGENKQIHGGESGKASKLETSSKSGTDWYVATFVSSYDGQTYKGEGSSKDKAKENAKNNYKENASFAGKTQFEREEMLATLEEDSKKAQIVKKFKTGGLADFTGPAWLDGTKSKPEYVLNAEQTKSFFTLVDILSSLDNHKPKNENTVATTIDVDINIETVKEEADVDMLADKVQKAIVTSAQYRNNNFIQR